MRSPHFGTENNLIKPGNIRALHSVLVFFTLLLLTLPSTPAFGDEYWRTTRFKVFTGNPFVGTEWAGTWLDLEDEDSRPSEATISAIETAFSEAASWYKRNGFPAPRLLPLIETDEGPAYQVYLCSSSNQSGWETFWREQGYGGRVFANLPWGRCGFNPPPGRTSSGAYKTLCGHDSDRTRIMYINRDKAVTGIGLNESGYQTIAHELMHAIIANTPFGRSFSDGDSCEINKWITEGIADAISYDIMDELWQGQYQPYTNSKAVIKQYGYRPYVESLTKSEEVPIPGQGESKADTAYGASSFWRFIKNAHSQHWKVLSAKNGLLNNPLSGSGWQNEVKWLDDGLYKIFKVRLQDFYVSFVSFLAYALPSMVSYRGKPPEDNLPHWSKILFGECKEVDLGAAAIVEVALNIDPLATRCLWVQTPGVSGTVKISFSAQSADIRLFKDIIIGLPGQAGSTRGIPATPEGGGTLYGTWMDFPQDGSKRQLFLVSNIARKPGRTEQRTFTLTAMLPASMNSAMATVPLPAARPVPPPEPPAFKKHAKSLTQQRRARSAMARQQLIEDKKSLTTHTSSAIDVSRRPNMPECTDPFRFDPCGPHIVIGLNIVPGSYLSPGQVSAQGGMAAQVFTGMQTLAETSLFDSSQMAQQLSARIDAIDGSSVGIAIPMIEYGYTGTISNASIHVDMSGGRTWRAIGPPDQNHRTRLTGRVTIEEYTPHVMRGSFVAPLAEFAQSAYSEEAVYTPRDTVSGSFTSVAPWRGDGRFEPVLDSVDEMAEDIAGTFGISPEVIDSIMEDTQQSSTSPGSSGSSSGSSSEVGCSCECEMKEFADDLCELFCEDEFAECN